MALAVLTLVAGALPASVAYVGSLIVDAVVAAMRSGGAARRVAELVVLEGALVAIIAAAQRGLSLCQSLLRAQLGQRVNVMILEKALTLELQHFEDSEFYDKLTRARREASTRPLSLVTRTFGLVQNAISLVSYGALLAHFSPWAVAGAAGSRACRRSWPKRSSPAMPSGCSAGARPRRACRSTSRPCSRARTTPRRSSSTASGRACSSAIATSSGGCTARTAH